jgi:hypothetical protein
MPNFAAKLYETTLLTDKQSSNRPVSLGIHTTLTLIIIGSLTIWNSRTTVTPKDELGVILEDQKTARIVSPFEKTMAYVRFNDNAQSNHIQYAMAYEPFFHTVHMSIPSHPADLGSKFYTNLTQDSWEGSNVLYQGVAETMRMIIDVDPSFMGRKEDSSNMSIPNEPIHQAGPSSQPASEIEGLMFYHFDSWIDPLAFSGDDLSKIWFPGAWGQDPHYQCVNDTKLYTGQWRFEDHNQKALAAIQTLRNLKAEYIFPPHAQFCTG